VTIRKGAATQQGPEDPTTTERREQGRAGHDRRKHHRQGHEGSHDTTSGEFSTRQYPGEREAEDQGDDRGRRGREQAEPQCVEDHGVGQLSKDVGQRGATEQAEQWKCEEEQAESRHDRQHDPRISFDATLQSHQGAPNP
jgi:hypothetical protein